MVGSLAQVLQPTALEAGTLIIGIYDMDYYVHSSFQYHLQVRSPAPARAAPWSTMCRIRCGRPAEVCQEVSSGQRRLWCRSPSRAQTRTRTATPPGSASGWPSAARASWASSSSTSTGHTCDGELAHGASPCGPGAEPPSPASPASSVLAGWPKAKGSHLHQSQRTIMPSPSRDRGQNC